MNHYPKLYGAMSCSGQDILEAAGALRHARYPEFVVEAAEDAAKRLLSAIEQHRAEQRENADAA